MSKIVLCLTLHGEILRQEGPLGHSLGVGRGASVARLGGLVDVLNPLSELQGRKKRESTIRWRCVSVGRLKTHTKHTQHGKGRPAFQRGRSIRWMGVFYSVGSLCLQHSSASLLFFAE